MSLRPMLPAGQTRLAALRSWLCGMLLTAKRRRLQKARKGHSASSSWQPHSSVPQLGGVMPVNLPLQPLRCQSEQQCSQ